MQEGMYDAQNEEGMQKRGHLFLSAMVSDGSCTAQCVYKTETYCHLCPSRHTHSVYTPSTPAP